MTIAVGFKCMDGIVLAADSLYSDGVIKLRGQKIFPITSNGRYALTIAGAGDVVNLKGVVQEVKAALKQRMGDRDTTARDIQTTIEDVLCQFYSKHIDSAPDPKREYLQVALLIGVWVAGESTRLFETCRTKATEVDDHRCVGFGGHLAEYLTDLFFPPGIRPSVEEAKPLAAYIVGRTKEYVELCGGSTFVRALLNDGTDDRVWNEEIKDSEEYFGEFFKTLGHLRALLNSTVDVIDIDMAPFTKVLKDGVVEFKAKQRVYREKEAAIRRASRSPHT